ncbi:hypothetical protein DPEC_G00062250 [Dallia pectoralis]|uniref:Uncharacterized protein n=1 Tax=Dallia pectoralis TaxID=75939 RepID=A0ACC2H7D3_DALPE|nr:hypothetical protein DPEC_G00062250 [Dallia pectoralis]
MAFSCSFCVAAARLAVLFTEHNGMRRSADTPPPSAAFQSRLNHRQIGAEAARLECSVEPLAYSLRREIRSLLWRNTAQCKGQRLSQIARFTLVCYTAPVSFRRLSKRLFQKNS